VILISNVAEWIKHRYPWYIQSFNLGMYFITVECTSLVYALINPAQTLFSVSNIIALIIAMATFTLVNHLLVGMVVWVARGEDLVKSGIFDFLPLVIDFTLLAMGASGALLWMVSPFAVVLSALPIYLIYSTLKVPALERKTETDQKTGLFNDQYFQHALQIELDRANRFGRPITVAMADMDLLRNINNTYGHLAGDEVLIGVARILKGSFRDVDTVARFGGEEFAILMPETTPEEIYAHIDEVRQKIQETEFMVETSVTPIHVTLSFGIAGREEQQVIAKELIHNADSALYHAKLNGRNRAYIYTADGYQALFQQTSEVSTPATQVEVTRADLATQDSQPQQTSSTRPQAPPEKPTGDQSQANHPTWHLHAFIGFMAIASLVLFYVLFHPIPKGFDWLGLVALTGILALTEWFSVDIYYRDTSVSTSTAPLLAGVFLFGPLGLLVMSLTFALIAKVKHNSKWSRVIFNTSNQLFAGLICFGMIHLTAVSYPEWGFWAQILLALVSAAIFYISTTVAISMAMHLDAGLPFSETWKEKFSWLLPYYLVLGLVALILAYAYQSQGLLGTGIVIIPLLLMRFSQKQFIDRTRGAVNELKEKNVILVRNADEIQKLNEGLLNALAEVIDLRDPYVLGHSKQVTQYAVMLASRMGLPAEQIEVIRKASLLHDIGKLGISDKILRKPGPLTKEEFAIIRGHPLLGAEILAASQALAPLIPVVRHHHEQYDGNGYPGELGGEQIPVEARIVAVADAVESMASDRPYRRALSYQEIIVEIQKTTGTQFDPLVASIMLDLLREQGEQGLVNSAHHTTNQLAVEQFAHLMPELSKRGLSTST
jgi:diguanylate cyclase (GGDEF)-like protein/putative nucleotidyltransferase with HDIG domain